MALAAKAIPATKPDTKLAEATATATTAAAATTIWRPKATSTPTTMTLRPVDVQQNGQKP
ncbi:GL12405 [Drosophila persimilis]|nr:GL12405 [Drosophila persimilis]